MSHELKTFPVRDAIVFAPLHVRDLMDSPDQPPIGVLTVADLDALRADVESQPQGPYPRFTCLAIRLCGNSKYGDHVAYKPGDRFYTLSRTRLIQDGKMMKCWQDIVPVSASDPVGSIMAAFEKMAD